MASGEMPLTVFTVLGRDVLTDLLGVGASGVEATASRRICGGGNVAVQHDAVHLNVWVRVRDRREQRPRVRMERMREDVLLAAEFHHRAEVHNADLIRNELDDREIVRNEQISQSHRALKILQKIDDLCLNGHVKRRNGLVADDQLGLYREGARDADSLALAARKFVRITLVVVVAETASFHQIEHVFLDLVLRNDIVYDDGLGEDVTDRASRGKRGVGILEDDLHFRADRTHFRVLVARDVLALEEDLTARRLVELQDGSSHRGFSTARFTDDAECFTGIQLEGHLLGNNGQQNLVPSLPKNPYHDMT